ncbi:hypothetical protein BFP72_07555 [Reichenbachiella sp. 5M10]|uniref:S8 family peptidase n=1 Tax=Reichenbachiella sp. 5M10 TaxID=1889772 RepID=UPI000C157F41|nr:S8 family peptidase [Reichenbachiella sp. 5M10]PIB35262.1 hypothetical protein BFP72_07555 [Reichenbachiella sp. 5M10]
MAKQKSKLLLLVGVLLLGFQLHAEKNRYVVFFADKAETKYRIDSPLEYLSQKALDRRAKNNQEITVDDFPVNTNYLDSLVKYNVTPYFTSRWFNAALVEAELSDLETLALTDYITGYEYVAPGTRLNPIRETFEVTFEGREPSIVSSNSSNQLRMMGVSTMHEAGYTGEGVHVAVLDGGFESVDQSAVFAQVFGNNRLMDHLDFTTNSENVFVFADHGTNALSCMMGYYKEVLVGPGYDMDLSLYITEDVSNSGNFEYRIEEYNWLFAAERADSTGVDIISTSLGYNHFEDANMNYSYEDTDGKTSVISRAAALASEKGILVVCSAGNEGNGSWKYITMPADVASVLTVGAVNSQNQKSSFSSIGATAAGVIKPDVVALGQGVSVFHSDNSIGTNSGTSFSAPLIAGLAGGLWQQFPELTNHEIKQLILSISDHYSDPNNEVGYGLPNYKVLTGESILSIDEVFADSFTIFPNPFGGDNVSIRIEKGYARQDLNLKLYAPDGQLITSEQHTKVRKGDVIELKVSGQARGMYILSLQSGDQLKNVKLLRY